MISGIHFNNEPSIARGHVLAKERNIFKGQIRMVKL